VNVFEVFALGPPLRDTVCPVNTILALVPAESDSVTDAV